MNLEDINKEIPEEFKKLSEDFSKIGFIYEWRKGALDWE